MSAPVSFHKNAYQVRFRKKYRIIKDKYHIKSKWVKFYFGPSQVEDIPIRF
jgi:hypothetical protein